MTRRLLLSYLTMAVVVLLVLEVPLAVFYAGRERERLTANVEHDANVLATLYEDDLERDQPLDPGPAEAYRERTGARVVVVDRDGISRVDTERPVERDFSTRPEMADALQGVRTSGTRHSDTLGTDLLYVAVPVASGGTVHGALRVTLDTREIDARIHRFWWGLAGVAAVVLAAVALAGWGLARSLTFPIRQLHASADRFAAGDLTPGGPVDGPAELRSLGATMDMMAARLGSLLGAQRAFVADASHQLRTPLTAMRLRLENLQHRLPEGSAGDLDPAIEETDRLAALVTDLLQIARADEPTAPVATDLAPVVADRVETWTAVADALGVALVASGTDGPAPALAVPGATEQVLDNLLDNSLAASPRGQAVSVDLSVLDGGRVRLAVRDHGPGLGDEEKALAVRRFWRGAATTPGTGLGLSIVDALVASSGGSLRLEDTPGGGLTVVVELPPAPIRG